MTHHTPWSLMLYLGFLTCDDYIFMSLFSLSFELLIVIIRLIEFVK